MKRIEVMVVGTDGTSTVVLSSDGRRWLEERLARIQHRLEQILADFAAERSEELLAEQQQLTEQADELQDLLRRAVSPAAVLDDPSVVEIGDEVEVTFADGSREVLRIVHPAEAGMDEQRTSAESPLARALLGRREGDRVEVDAPSGRYECTIVRRTRLE